MDFKTKHIGSFSGNPAKIIELTVAGWNGTITEDITDLKGNVDEKLIMALRNLADELEEHNLKNTESD